MIKFIKNIDKCMLISATIGGIIGGLIARAFKFMI